MEEKILKNKGIVFAVCMLFLVAPSLGAINAALSSIGQDFSHITASGLTYLTSITSVSQMLVGLCIGMIAGKKIRYKTLVIISLLICIVVGGIPVFFTGETPFVLFVAARFVLGLGLGCCMPCANAYITKLFTDEKKRSNVMGIGNAFFNGGTVIATLAGGFLAAGRWQNTFYIYPVLGALTLLVVVCFLKEPPHEEKAEQTKARISGSAFVFLALFLIFSIFQQPIWTALSVVLAEANLGNAAIAGTLMSAISLVMVAASFFLGPCYRMFKKQMLTIFALLAGVGFVFLHVGASPENSISALVWIGGIVVGVAVALFTGGINMILSMVVDTSAVTAVMGFSAVFMNIGVFLSSPYMQIATRISGNNETRFVYLFSGIGMVLVAGVLFIFTKRSVKENGERI